MDDTPESQAAIPARAIPPATREDLFALFDALGIAVEKHAHEPVFTVEESQFLRGLLPGAHSKNLYLRNKKGEAWLVVCEENRRIDLKALATLLDAGRLSFGSAERLMEQLGVPPGSVTPFALINDRFDRRVAERPVTLILDAAMMRERPLNFHPLVNDMTCAIAPEDLLKFVAHCGHDAHIIDLDGAAPAAP